MACGLNGAKSLSKPMQEYFKWTLRNFSEFVIAIPTFSFKKINLKILSAKWCPSCLGFNVINALTPIHLMNICTTFCSIFVTTKLMKMVCFSLVPHGCFTWCSCDCRRTCKMMVEVKTVIYHHIKTKTVLHKSDSVTYVHWHVNT